MFEARLIQGSLLKKIVEAVKDLVSDANLDCTEEGLTMQVRTTSFSSRHRSTHWCCKIDSSP